jgi:predicted nucleic acid-binding protein
MERIVIDASVIVKFFLDENYSENAYILRDLFIRGLIEIIEPPLLEYEVLSALFNSNRLKKPDLLLAVNAFYEYGFTIIETSYGLASSIIELAEKYKITTYDAVYVALAMSTNSKLYTADEKLVSLKLPFVKHIKQIR